MNGRTGVIVRPVSDAASWSLSVGVTMILLAVLGFFVRSDAELQGSYRDAMRSDPRPTDPEARARNWIANRYRKWLLLGGLALLLVGTVATLA
jgi:hypothetical protein